MRAARPRAVLSACWLALLAGAVGVAGPACAAEPVVVRYPSPQNDLDRVFIASLQLVLEHAPGAYAAQQWDATMERNRAVHELVAGGKIDVLWAVTNRERERLMLPVRIPLDKGLSGWRVPMIRQGDAARFAAVRTRVDLAQFKAATGLGWAETVILRANGLPVVEGSRSSTLYSMLGAGRFDYFPRPIGQAWQEAPQAAEQGVAIEPRLVLHFPSAVYYFVQRGNTALASALEQGLRAALADGSYDKLFNRYNAEALRQADLRRRRVIELDNPELGPETPLADKSLWLDPLR